MWLLILVLLVLLAAAVLKSYNVIRNHKETLKESLSNISVVTSKKISLVNQLIAIVQSYQESEKFVMLKISSDSVQGVQNASAMSGTVIADIGRVAQRFPDLKSNGQYNRLMDALQSSEQEVQNARTVYNHYAKVYNTARSSVPTIFFATALGFDEAQYLSIGTTENASLRVQQIMASPDAERVNALVGIPNSRAIPPVKMQAQQEIALTEQAELAGGGQTTRTFRFCPACGVQNASNAAFCGACGTKL